MRTNTFSGPGPNDPHLAVTLLQVDWPYTIELRATGNGADGRGARGAIPLHLELSARDVGLQPGVPRKWRLRLHSE